MTTAELNNLIKQLRTVEAERPHVEAKRAESEMPRRLWETLSAFANTHGGTIILGLDEANRFAVVGTRNASKIRRDVASLCDEMVPPLRPRIAPHYINGKTLIVVEVPEIAATLKPCYYAGASLTNGAFVRVADGDRKLSAYEAKLLLASRVQLREDEEPIPEASAEDSRKWSAQSCRLPITLEAEGETPRNNGDHLSVLPFLKWPGGKRWLVPDLLNLIGAYPYETYFEPFLGGGALFFALRPRRSLLSDINHDLINTYRQVKYRSTELVQNVRALQVNKKTFNSLRKNVPASVLERAARFLYLNRTAFGGMYRLNQRGEFNVPFGGERTTSPLWESAIVTDAAKALRHAQLLACDFEVTMARAQAGDLVYCDPTYTVAHNDNGFIRYNERNFSWDDQKRLARSCREAAERGVCVVVSNAYHQDLLSLFTPPRHVVVNRFSRLCPQVQHRRAIEEFVFIFPPRRDAPSGSR